ncbi:DUF6745 domain-containing protein [Micromonospora sp. U21]|uniref:DUF6745 domain-containing protein n=1 Tax=Micromonospora sp. U21 TaxID=2824899 RepID=UPI0035A92E06
MPAPPPTSKPSDVGVLTAINTYRDALGAAPDPASQGCRDVALASGPWWPFPDTALMSERPAVLKLDDQGRLHADNGPAIRWLDGHPVWEREGILVDARVGSTPADTSPRCTTPIK